MLNVITINIIMQAKDNSAIYYGSGISGISQDGYRGPGLKSPHF